MLSLMMIDVDSFKQYNDTYGHVASDNCLRSIARVLAQSLSRTGDFVARYGGEEFVAVLPNTDENGARLLAEKLLRAVHDCKMPHKENTAAEYLTVSIGVTTGRVRHTHTADDFIARADEMLYKSKNAGRNQYNFGSL